MKIQNLELITELLFSFNDDSIMRAETMLNSQGVYLEELLKQEGYDVCGIKTLDDLRGMMVFFKVSKEFYNPETINNNIQKICKIITHPNIAISPTDDYSIANVYVTFRNQSVLSLNFLNCDLSIIENFLLIDGVREICVANCDITELPKFPPSVKKVICKQDLITDDVKTQYPFISFIWQW